MDSTFFGVEKNLATGVEEWKGVFELAAGALFLNEIFALETHLQAKLLKAIKKTIRRIGGSVDIHLDIRIISATNERSFETLLKENRMREDLYYRLGVIQIDLPELKNRKDDIEMLVSHFIHF